MAARGGPDLDYPIILHTAQSNMNAKFSQLFRSSLPTIVNWVTFIEWGTRAQYIIKQQKRSSVAAVSPVRPGTKCFSCQQEGHWSNKCPNKKRRNNSPPFAQPLLHAHTSNSPDGANTETGTERKLKELLNSIEKLAKALEGSD